LDDVVTTDIGKFEKLFLEHMRANHQNLMDDVRMTGVLTGEQDKKLGEILTDWIPSSGLELRAK